MWDVLLATEQEAKQLAGSSLTMKTLRLQIEYMSTRRTIVMLHGVTVDITEDRMGAFFAEYEKVDEVSKVISKTGISNW